MRVASYSMAMNTAYSASQSLTTRNTLELQTPADNPRSARPDNPVTDQVQLSPAGTSAASNLKLGSDMPPLINLIKSILEKVLGIHFELVDGALTPTDGEGNASTASPPRQSEPASPGVSGRYTSSMTYQETEQLSFSAAGSVTTADGKKMDFSLDVQMQRSFSFSSSQSVTFGNPGRATDPLMITLGSGAGSLSGASVQFDLLGNGQKVALPFASSGGWLALDSNGNGKIDDGSELFGPQSGNGFQDLAALDSNHDGVLDDADPSFARLRLWSGVDKDGKDQLQTLQSVKIGAILLPSISTPFTIKDPGNHAVASLSRSGVYLTEDGHAGQISQVDVMS